MSARGLRLLALAAVAIVQLAVPAAMIFGRERTLAAGTEWRFRVEPVDPADAFRGRYLALRFAATEAPLAGGTHVEAGDRVYVPLGRDAAGFATLGPAAITEPASGDFLRLRVAWPITDDDGSRRVHLELPFDRLYLAEELAPQAEEAYFAAVRARPGATGETARPAWALVRVRAGDAVLQDVVVEGVPIRELVTRRNV
jgi:hypothetical protein